MDFKGLACIKNVNEHKSIFNGKDIAVFDIEKIF